MAPDLSAPDLRFDVIIAGGGFSGVYCARALEKALGETARERVALISDQNAMVFQPMLAEVAGSALSPRHVVNPIRRLCRHTSVLRGAIAAVDMPSRVLTLQAGDFTPSVTIGFEHLVLVLGGVVDLSRVPGMPEHALLMKNVGDALKLRAAIIDRFEEANLESDPIERRRLLSFTVVGGGYSGVETAGQILDLAKEMLGFYPRIPEDALRVVLIHSGAHLLPEINESLGRYCEENLRARGLEIILNARVTAVTGTRVLLKEGQAVEAHTMVSTVGNAPHPLLTELCRQGHIECEKGRVLADSTLRVIGQERLWAAGDCAAVPMAQKHGAPEVPAPPRNADAKAHPGLAASSGGAAPSAKQSGARNVSPFEARPYCPPTAQFAYRQGTLLGKNLARVLEGRGELEPFTFTGLGELASIGHRAAVAEIMGCRFSGFFAWFLWRSIYLAKLPGIERKLRVMMEWTLDLFFPRDIALLQPKPTQLVKEMHLEKGDSIFQCGEPASSLYVVKSGGIQLLDDAGATLRTLAAGDQIGRNTLLGSKIWPFDAVATEATTLVAVSGKLFEVLAKSGAAPEQIFPSMLGAVAAKEARAEAGAVPPRV